MENSLLAIFDKLPSTGYFFKFWSKYKFESRLKRNCMSSQNPVRNPVAKFSKIFIIHAQIHVALSPLPFLIIHVHVPLLFLFDAQ